MKRKTKNTIFTILAIALAGYGGWYLWNKNKGQNGGTDGTGGTGGTDGTGGTGGSAGTLSPGTTTTGTTTTGTTTTVTVPASTLKIGDRVLATSDVMGVHLNNLEGYAYGGSNNDGIIKKGQYAGTISGFTANSDLVVVDNFTYTMKDSYFGDPVTRYRLDKKKLAKG